MKYFKLTYYLIFICIVAASCSADDNIVPDQASEAVRVQLTIQFPQTATRATPAGTGNERNIDNLHLYVFEKKEGTSSYVLKEEARGINIGDADESGNRTITGVLFEGYTDNKIKLVALANLKNKGLDFGSLPGKGTELSKFYEKLIYTRTNNINQWPIDGNNQLPMWGECDMNAPKPGSNTGSLSLTRAVAKVDVLVNNGKGIEGKKFFKITQIKVRQFNDCGYCTPGIDASTPNVPTEAKKEMTIYTGSIGYACENRIYIPEQKNIGVADNQKLFLNLTATIDDAGIKTKEFRIDFKKDGIGNDFDILRNNKYVFNITSVEIEQEVVVSINLTYRVAAWEGIQIDVPAFGGE